MHSDAMDQSVPAEKHAGPQQNALPGACESTWLFYARRLGIATSICVAFATLLHELYCERSGDLTHWGAAAMLSILCGVLALVFSLVWRSFYVPLAANMVCSTTLIVSLWTMDLCDVHQRLYVAMSAMSILVFGLTLREKFYLDKLDSTESPHAAATSEPGDS